MGLRVHELPVIGNWYWDIDHSLQFEVVASDDHDGGVEIQYFEGELEEIDMDTWYEMNVVSIAAPNDWTGPFEVDRDQFPELKDETLAPTDNSFDYFE